MARVLKLRLRSVEAKIIDLRALDPIDIEILRFIEEKYGGTAPLGELKSVAVVGGLAPRLRELMSIPSVAEYLPPDILSSVSTALAEREIDARIAKLESLNLLMKSVSGEETRVVLTDVGKAVASMGGIPTFRSDSEALAFLHRLRMELPPQSRYPLQSGEHVAISTMDELELSSREVAILSPSPTLSLFGVSVSPRVIEGPFSDRPTLIVGGGYAPIVLERGQVVAIAIAVKRDEL
ncbi:MAG: hypothetical protein GXO32_02655 [Crenarchaeota archaeon]|nr:hypothetical protein [Thermoproteota archaeon]